MATMKPRQKPAGVTSAAEADFLGEGTYGPQQQNVTPEQLKQNARDVAAGELDRSQTATAQRNQPYRQQRSAEDFSGVQLNNQVSKTSAGKAGVEWPFIKDIPLVGNTVAGALTGAQKGGLAYAQDLVDHPYRNALSAGLSAGIAGVDSAADSVGTGVVRDVTGNEKAEFNAPLTPAQLWDPNGPLIDRGKGGKGNVNIPGIKDIGEGIGEGVSAAVKEISEAPGEFEDWLLGGEAAGPARSGGVSASGLTPGGVQKQALDSASANTQLGLDVLSGATGGPNPADRALQTGALDSAQAFASGPRATDAASRSAAGFRTGERRAEDVLGDLDGFIRGPQGPSQAQLLLDKASQDAMRDVLSVSRSGRSRNAGDQARAEAVAQGEIAGMGVDNARNASLLRAQETNDQLARALQATGMKGDVLGGLDQGTLSALGLEGNLAGARDANTLGAAQLQGDLASQIRAGGSADRGQTLSFAQGQAQTGANQQGNVLSTLAPLGALNYEMTPQQKLRAALMGAGGDLLSVLF